MSSLDMLLGAGDSILQRPEDELEVSRLTKVLGGTFSVKIQALTMREIDELSKEDFKAHVVLAGVIDPDFHSKELAKKFTPNGRKTPLTPIELINVLFLPGELVNLYNAIMDLSGYGSDAVEKIKKK